MLKTNIFICLYLFIVQITCATEPIEKIGAIAQKMFYQSYFSCRYTVKTTYEKAFVGNNNKLEDMNFLKIGNVRCQFNRFSYLEKIDEYKVNSDGKYLLRMQLNKSYFKDVMTLLRIYPNNLIEYSNKYGLHKFSPQESMSLANIQRVLNPDIPSILDAFGYYSNERKCFIFYAENLLNALKNHKNINAVLEDGLIYIKDFGMYFDPKSMLLSKIEFYYINSDNTVGGKCKIICLNNYEIIDDGVTVPTNIKIENYNTEGDLIFTNNYSILKDSIKLSNQANENFIIKLPNLCSVSDYINNVQYVVSESSFYNKNTTEDIISDSLKNYIDSSNKGSESIK